MVAIMGGLILLTLRLGKGSIRTGRADRSARLSPIKLPQEASVAAHRAVKKSYHQKYEQLEKPSPPTTRTVAAAPQGGVSISPRVKFLRFSGLRVAARPQVFRCIAGLEQPLIPGEIVIAGDTRLCQRRRHVRACFTSAVCWNRISIICDLAAH